IDPHSPPLLPNYLVIWCIDLEVEEKQALMEQVAHQTIVMQFILELAKSLKVDPRACFRQFFTKIKTADQQYMEGFNDELEAFKDRVRGRAKARIERAMREYEEEERQKRLGPGGLDPVEVYESLPEVSGGLWGDLWGRGGSVGQVVKYMGQVVHYRGQVVH
ncbi:hsp90 co-chaperone Cdc37, partial [Coturnix japonica]|uniref:hsp90 co-chaperone Cdc37 n=1 Tax=Coturnix japonica TaxID=93934 RepID=UPI0007771835